MEEIIQAINAEDPAPLLPAGLRGLPAALVLFVSAYLFTCLTLYLSYYSRIRPPQAGLAALVAFAVITALFMAWSGVWAAAGRIFRQRTCFAAHISIASAAYLAWNVLTLIVSAAAFSFDADKAFRPLKLVVFWFCAVWAITCHLGLVSKLRRKTVLIISLLLVTVLSGVWLGFTNLSEKMAPGSGKAVFDLWPPMFRLVKGKPAGEFAAKLSDLRIRVDKAADSEK